VTASAGFGITTALGNAITLSPTPPNTSISFSTASPALITGAQTGIFSFNNGTGAVNIATTGTTTGTAANGIEAFTFGNGLAISTATTNGGINGIKAKKNGPGALNHHDDGHNHRRRPWRRHLCKQQRPFNSPHHHHRWQYLGRSVWNSRYRGLLRRLGHGPDNGDDDGRRPKRDRGDRLRHRRHNYHRGRYHRGFHWHFCGPPWHRRAGDQRRWQDDRYGG